MYWQVVIQQQYILENDSEEVQLEKLRAMSANLTHCIAPSGHKVVELGQYLSNKAEFRRKYYAERIADNLVEYTELRVYIGSLHEKYETALSGRI